MLAAAPEGDEGLGEGCSAQVESSGSVRPWIVLDSDAAGGGNDVFEDHLADAFGEVHERKGLCCDGQQVVEGVVHVWEPEGRHINGHLADVE